MRLQLMALLVMLGACLLPVGPARADTTVRVVETWPSGDDITLARNQNFYLRLAYSSDVPVGIWARPYFQGKPAKAGSNPSQRYSGDGETFGWFFLQEPGTEVDEIRITAGDGTVRGTPVVVTWRGRIVGDEDTTVAGTEPAWIAQAQARVEAEQRQENEERANTPVSAGDIALFNGFMLTMYGLGLLGFAGPAWGMWRWRGGWRIAAAVPAVMVGFVVLRLMIDTASDSTSHNLWPFEILMVAALSVAVMGALMVARRVFGAGSAT